MNSQKLYLEFIQRYIIENISFSDDILDVDGCKRGKVKNIFSILCVKLGWSHLSRLSTHLLAENTWVTLLDCVSIKVNLLTSHRDTFLLVTIVRKQPNLNLKPMQ